MNSFPARKHKRAEDLRQASEPWRRLAEALPHLVWTATADGACDYFSARWRDYTGIPESELLGWRWLEALHPDDRQPTRQCWTDSVAGRGPYEVEYRVRRSDGRYGWFKTRGSPMRDSKGNIVKWFGTCTDITDGKEAEEALRRSRQELRQARSELEMKVAERTKDLRWTAAYLMEAQRLSHTGSFGWRVSTDEFFWSDETFRIFEYDASTKITSQLIIERVHPEDRTLRQETLDRAARERRDFDFEYRLLMPDASVKHIHIVAHAVKEDPGGLDFIGALMDVTAAKEAEAQRRESEQQYRRIVDTASEGICVFDEHYITTFVNRRFAEMLGYDPEEMLGRKYSDFLFEEDLAVVEERTAARRQGAAERYEQSVRRKDGRHLWVHISATPILDRQGRFQGSFSMFTDITQRIMAEEELRKHRDHLEDLVKKRTEELALLNQLVYGSLASTDVGAWWIDFKEEDTYHGLDNSAQMLGLAPDKSGEKAYRLSVWAKLLADTKAAFSEYAGVIDETMERFSGAISGKYKSYSAIYPVALPDGSVKWFNARADVPSRDEQGRALLMTGTLIDITKLKQAEEDLLEAKERAESANRAKSIFLASMSHELRTPLNVVLGFSRLMKNEQGIPANQRENLDIIVRSGEHLLNLINNVLDISKIESGRVVLEESEADLHQLLHELQSVMGVRAAEKGLSFTLEQSPTLPRHIAVDAGKLRQVLINLIGNATKYTEHGGLKLRANVVSRESPQRARLRFEVEDSGPGISEEDRQRIFFPFVQLGNRAPAEAGTGLGLAISKQYVELMGGQIGVASEPGKGSVFHFDIPVGVLPAAEIPTELGRGRVIGLAEGQARFRLLLAEDQRENRLLLRKLFEPLGFDLREAVNGQEAVVLFEEWHPDLIWMDIRMPVMDGLEAARRIKATAAGRRAKIVALTAHALEEEREPILAAGCDDVVRKPYREQELFEVMARHLDLRYLYEKAGERISPVGSKAVIRPEQWAALPLELLTQLHQAAVELDTTRTLALIQRITELDASIGSLLNDLATKLDYPHLLRLLEGETKARQSL